MADRLHRVVVLGGGFGGISAVDTLKRADVEITIIDRRNHHLFQPLLYQVATAALDTSQVAWTIRALMRNRPKVKTLMGTVTDIDTEKREVHLEDESTVPYHSLIISTGSRHDYFGNDHWEELAPGLKTLEDAVAIRRQVLMSFEAAEREPDPQKQKALMTFAIVGAGPTGVELAGAIIELAKESLRDEYRSIDPRNARVVLIEGGDQVLGPFDDELSEYAKQALEKRGVEVVLNQLVSAIDEDGLDYGEERLEAKTVVWAAGVRASPAARWLGVEADKAGRVPVNEDLSVKGFENVFCVGDTASMKAPDGSPVPGIADAAKQSGRHAANMVLARLGGEPTKPFAYKHKGDLATIGKRAAAVDLGWIKLKGKLAWWVWGIAHIYFLIDARNRIQVILSWLFIYLTGRRGAQLISQGPAAEPDPMEEVTDEHHDVDPADTGDEPARASGG
ncbi:NADH dehydrogenase [Devosia pacifica]|uniref:NADH:ubiquinone reductase (non-electrogenic) n=1 Tax=Devosia pacifica TaxID=1335967 RepID=A0A918SAF3_9HYPH|nr:NAD(P)/FAD-dependent oxidoreductase [Devosia pacifica]GHA29082.1 NADH dehydrogenase [Devosia pacifica]